MEKFMQKTVLLSFTTLAIGLLTISSMLNTCVSQPKEIPEEVSVSFNLPTQVDQSSAAPLIPVAGKMVVPYSPHAYVLKVMMACLGESKASAGPMQLRAKQIYRISRERLIHQPAAIEYFPTLICIESKYEQSSKSLVGAVGLTQVMPQFAKEFGEACGIPGITGADLQDSEINLTIGACRFGALVKYFEGQVPLALAAYNAGRDAPAVRRLQAGTDAGITETNGYLVKAFTLNYKLKRGDK